MDTKETIRNTLIERQAERIYKIMKDSSFVTKMQGILKDIFKEMFGEINVLDGEEDEKDFDSVFDSELANGLETALSDPVMVRNEIYKGVRQQYMPPKTLDQVLKPVYALLENNISEPSEAVKAMKDTGNKYLNLLDFNTYVVDSLTEIAERKGLEKALTEEAECEVIRQRIPKREDFIAHSRESLDLINDYLGKMQEGALMGEEAGHEMAVIFGVVGKYLEEFQKLGAEDLNKRADQIYGKAK